MAEGMDEVDFLTEKDLLRKYGEAGLQTELLELIPPLVSREDNFMLEEPVSLKEVKSTIFGLGGEKAPGPDGFQVFFFQFFWDELGEELLAMSGFTPGRNIVDGVIVAHEAIHKAMKVNGSPQGFFSTSRGIQQGDPISPFLFILLAEVLGRSIAHKRAQRLWKGIEIAQGVDSTTHSQFADDTCLFGVASMHKASVIKKVLDKFSWATGQEINWLKSKIFFFHMKCWSQRAITRLFGIKIRQLPSKFLGMPLFAGVGKMDIWQGLPDGYKAKMEGWKSKWLSLASRILMLKSVVLAMPIFPMDKVPLMAWDRVCIPKGGGGVGLRDWRLINEAMGANLRWSWKDPRVLNLGADEERYLSKILDNR
ncbi:uncharacterized protein LOC131070920 [Cryptomeria japonica]|uniref:uncharacterized protein LOC131070920 n=1 Tax=Cryptomeria japonica TaxID=3369 RepID=UPI0027DAA23A|nr:uncharacterized protein LOC131070920 [Cryptomeria japonica]